MLSKLKHLWSHEKLTIILLAHFKEKREEHLTGVSYMQYQINLYEKASELLRNWCSCVLFADDEVELIDEAVEFNRKISKISKSTRVLHTDGGTTFLAKNTYNLPAKIAMDSHIEPKSNYQVFSDTVSFKNDRFQGGGMRFLRFHNWLDEIHQRSGGIRAVYFEEVRRHLGVDAGPMSTVGF